MLRIAGDALVQPVVRRWGGMLGELAILLFLAMIVLAVRRGRRQPV
ncbi:MAG: hypothetical protein R2844_06530 [Caldilineales bacterium]